MKAPNCDSCGQSMKMTKERTTKQTGRHYCIRRFECELCGITTTLYAGGALDMYEGSVLNDVKKLHKQQERNNER